MLTADLVDVRRHGEALKLVALDGPRRALAESLAQRLVHEARARVGESREEVDAALAAVEAPARARRLLLGLRKVLDDASTWEGSSSLDPEAVRREVFERAAAVRAALSAEQHFDRTSILDEIAAARGVDAAAIEQALFADLRAAEVLRAVELGTGDALVARYAAEQVQAVLLRAVSVRVSLHCDSPGAYRAIFRQVKFLGLMHVLRPGEDGAYELEIDGPFSLFESVTKYGLRLAMLVPVLESARRYQLVADVRWGRGGDRKSLRFSHEGGGGRAQARPLSDEAEALRAALLDVATAWAVQVADTVLELTGVGLCVPDLQLVHRETGEVVYVELLGFWSREAVFRRKDLVERGLAERIVFVASSHLRVREELLDEEQAGALYVYKRVPSAQALLERVEALAARVIHRRR